MRIAVLGSGGVGGYIGASLAKNSTHEITMVARGEHADVMEKEGLGIIEDEVTWHTKDFKVCSLETLEGSYDVVLVCFKSYDLASAVDVINRYTDVTSIVIPFGNGIAPYELLHRHCHAKVFRGATYILSHLDKPGYIRKKGKVFAAVVGSDSHGEDVARIKALFESVNLRIKTPENIQEAIWKKYIFIGAFATLTSYYNANMRAVAEQEKVATLGVLEEIAMVAKAKGIEIFSEVEKSYETALSLPQSASSSMHLDFKNAKNTELETLSGYIVLEGEKFDIATPYMSKMYHALKNELYQK